MHFWSSFALGLAALVPSTYAHGYVSSVVVNGRTFNGPKPGGAPSTNGIRPVKSVNPLTMSQLNNAAMACNLGSSPAPGTIAMTPGETITFFWSDFDTATRTNKAWIHTKGPIMTYLTPCPGGVGACAKFSTDRSPVFFKFDEKGFKGDPADNIWVQSDVAAGQGVDVTIPSTLDDGEYLLRHEIIVLEGGEAQLYPACVQISIRETGGGKFPDRSLGLLFPGAYKATDPGLQVDFVAPYQFPGGPNAFSTLTDSPSTSGSSSALLPTTTSSVATTSVASASLQTTVAPSPTFVTETEDPVFFTTTPAQTTTPLTTVKATLTTIKPEGTQPAFATITETIFVTATPEAPTTTATPTTKTKSTSTVVAVVTVTVGADGKVSSASHGHKASGHRVGQTHAVYRRAAAGLKRLDPEH